MAEQARLLSFYEVRRDLALASAERPSRWPCASCPGLYWRDLMELGLDTRLRPTLRRAAGPAAGGPAARAGAGGEDRASPAAPARACSPSSGTIRARG